ncbi:uncharacterized protein [Drosophila takahashii]|uniref:uncharacterized protein n=1 Tax=Drosophila takahashii TaxID=29030 RepID=UPI0038990CA5
MATPSKISKRSFTDFSFDEPFQQPSVCTNCCEVKKQIAEINEKLEEIILSLAEQKIIVSQLMRQRVENTNVAKCFPIKDEEALNIVNQNINSCAKDSYIKAMRSLLLPEGVLKNLRRILTDKFVEGFNVKGLSGKKSRKLLYIFRWCTSRYFFRIWLCRNIDSQGNSIAKETIF